MSITTTSLQQFATTARVWIYQANEPFSEADIPAIKDHLQNFAGKWVSHSLQLTAGAELLHNRFVVLAVDENNAGASGCSIDSSVAFVKQLGAEYNRDLLDRMRFSYIDKNNQVQTVSKDEFKSLYAKSEITNETIVFDPLVKTVEELNTAFQKQLSDSWHSRFV